jgi:non-specific serine/threonine protein kinase
MLATGRGDYRTVSSFAYESSALWGALGNQHHEAFSLFLLGRALTRLCKFADARVALEKGLEVSCAGRDGGAEAICLFTLAELEIALGEDDEARVWAEAALSRALDLGQVRQIACARGCLGVLSMHEADFPGAATLLEASLATWRELGESYWFAEALVRRGQLAVEQVDTASACAHFTEALELARRQADRHTTAVALEGFAQIAVLEGQPRLALQLAAAAESVREAMGLPLPPSERSRLMRALDEARMAVGNRAADAWAQGRHLGIERASDLALAVATPRVARPQTRRNVLTGREQMVARLVAQGLTNRQIAGQLLIAEGTTERHVGNILGKLHMHARSQIAAWAATQDLLPPDLHTSV